jgi:DNA gyrase subunit B
MRSGQARASLFDCAQHGSDAELFLVEGESAAASVAAIRDPACQAVLALQGKPLNAWHASAAKVQAHALYRQLAQALGLAHATALAGLAAPELPPLRFGRVLLLLDPDADGIHIGALLLLYFQRWAPALIDAARLAQAQAPLFVLRPAGAPSQAEPLRVHMPQELPALRERLTREHGAPPQVQAVRGLGSLDPPWLAHWCVRPGSRRLHTVTLSDVQMVLQVFGLDQPAG